MHAIVRGARHAGTRSLLEAHRPRGRRGAVLRRRVAALGGAGRTGPVAAAVGPAQVVAPAITTDGLDVIITQDPRGRKLYVWSFEKWDQDHVRLPVYLGAVEATE